VQDLCFRALCLQFVQIVGRATWSQDPRLISSRAFQDPIPQIQKTKNPPGLASPEATVHEPLVTITSFMTTSFMSSPSSMIYTWWHYASKQSWVSRHTIRNISSKDSFATHWPVSGVFSSSSAIPSSSK
jgi:hypothetical protein